MFVLSRLVLLLGIVASVMFSSQSVAQMTLAIVGKTKNDTFYQKSFEGCQVFASKYPDVTCIYDGSDDYQDVRTQALIIEELLDKGIDGLLVSTTDSDFLASRVLLTAQRQGVPVITFDSDLLPQHAHFRLAYVGTNNFDFGVALAEAAKAYKGEETQSICIQSGHPTTPNLNERIKGVRYALSGNAEDKLDGRKGWVEHPRCPLYTLGQRDKALEQLLTMANDEQAPIFLAVAGFAQFNLGYIQAMTPFKQRIADQQLVVVSADTEAVQLEALAQGLSSINIGQDPFEMGRKSAELMYAYLKDGTAPSQEHYYLPFHYCSADITQHCTKPDQQPQGNVESLSNN
ncbi:substrate-binding domain-containing protein [Pseudoalteromonas sp. SSDWG2]|uniref:substrate-binding domain-containing protein n=1 Tax=Pseudoalteromonas sp. SSDWG2 TaxID=3139391 RepID=UPI003BADA7A9